MQQAAKLPVDVLSVGDWLRWENMGAYTICAASQVRPLVPYCPSSLAPPLTFAPRPQFNGFRKSLVRYTIDADAEVEKRIRALIA